MELEIQKYLRNGGTPDSLKELLGIKYSQNGNLIIFNYNQIESPKTHPIVMEARCLILEDKTWDVIFMAMKRFFNYGEALNLTDDFDFDNAVALDKIDGSIIGVFYYNGKWHMSTRGVIEGDCQVGTFPLTFKQLFDMTVSQYPNFWKALNEERQLDNDYCYTFELTAPENRVVTPYTDRALHLLTVRDRKNDFEELPRNDVERLAYVMGVRIPEMHSFHDIAALVQMAAGVGELNEGFVCIDYSQTDENGCYRRLKVKNPAYLAVAHLKESSASSLRSLLYLVMIGEADEFLAYFPEFQQYVDGLKEKWDEFKSGVESSLEEAESKKDLSRKDYAQWAKTCSHPGILFMYLDGVIETFQDWVDQQITKRGEKNFGKMMMKTLKIADIEWGIEA